MFRLGLTGSIGMGKSTTAQMFADRGCAVWDADARVHAMYAVGGAAVSPIGDMFPQAILNGAVDRGALRDIISADAGALERIEQIVHPLVRADRDGFAPDTEIAVFDIPLLFETVTQAQMDATACVWVDAAEQRRRVLARGTMDAAQFEAILAKQMPIEQKRALADYEIETDTLDHVASQVDAVLADVTRRMHDA